MKKYEEIDLRRLRITCPHCLQECTGKGGYYRHLEKHRSYEDYMPTNDQIAITLAEAERKALSRAKRNGTVAVIPAPKPKPKRAYKKVNSRSAPAVHHEHHHADEGLQIKHCPGCGMNLVVFMMVMQIAQNTHNNLQTKGKR